MSGAQCNIGELAETIAQRIEEKGNSTNKLLKFILNGIGWQTVNNVSDPFASVLF